MFSLIITIISIALVAALALATLYYGGSAFNKGADGATAAKLINEGQQINGAATIYKADLAAGAAVVTDLNGLRTAGYLSQVPASFTGATTVASNVAEAPLDLTSGVCDEVNKRAGLTAPVTQANGIYGCAQTATGAVGTFFFKF
jgi:hypothetical protein